MQHKLLPECVSVYFDAGDAEEKPTHGPLNKPGRVHLPCPLKNVYDIVIMWLSIYSFGSIVHIPTTSASTIIGEAAGYWA